MNINSSLLKGLIYSRYGSQAAISDSLGWGKNKIGKILKGKLKPSIDDCYNLYMALNLSKEEYISVFTPFLTPNGEKIIENAETQGA